MRHIDNPSSANILPGDCIVATSAQRAALSIGPEDAGKVIVEKDSGRMYLATMTEGAKPLSTNLAAELAAPGLLTTTTRSTTLTHEGMRATLQLPKASPTATLTTTTAATGRRSPTRRCLACRRSAPLPLLRLEISRQQARSRHTMR
jgi:hypothetical protein